MALTTLCKKNCEKVEIMTSSNNILTIQDMEYMYICHGSRMYFCMNFMSVLYFPVKIKTVTCTLRRHITNSFTGTQLVRHTANQEMPDLCSVWKANL